MTKTKTNLDPWEKKDHETSKAYAAFCAYRDMGTDRSFAKIIPTVYGQIPLSKHSAKRGQLSEWSVKYGWVARVEDYDVYLESKERHENELAIKKMAKQHAGEALLMQKVGLDRLKAIKVDELSPRDTVLFVKTGIDIERLARGAPDQIVEHGGNIGISKIEITTSKREDEEDESKV